MSDGKVEKLIREATDELMLLIVFAQDEIGQSDGEAILTRLIQESTDSLARLKERGLVNNPEED